MPYSMAPAVAPIVATSSGRSLRALVDQGDRRLGERVGLAQQRGDAVQLRIPAAGPRPARGEVVPGLVQRGDDGLMGGGELRRAGRPEHAGDGAVDSGGAALLRGVRCGDPPGHQQHRRPSHAGEHQQRRPPPGPQRPERARAENGVHEQLQAGDGERGPGRAHQRRDPGHQDQDGDRDPALAVHHLAEQEAGRAAENAGRGHPPNPRGIGAATVHDRAQQAAHRAEQARGLVPQGVAEGERPADGERGADHGRPRHRGRRRPDHLDEPRRHRRRGGRGGRGRKLARLPHPGPARMVRERLTR